MTRRAFFYDHASYKPETVISYRGLSNAYIQAARAAGQNPDYPKPGWLEIYVPELIAATSYRYARKLINACTYYFRLRQLANPFDVPAISAILTLHSLADRTDDDRDAERSTFLEARKRAKAFADDQLAPKTLRQYRRFADLWKTCAGSFEIDALHPPPDKFYAYIEAIAEDRLIQTVCNHINGLSHMFRSAEAADLTRDPEVWKIIEGAQTPSTRQATTVLHQRTPKYRRRG